MPQTDLGQDALQVIIEILESYLEFIDMVKTNNEAFKLPEQYTRLMKILCVRRQKTWQPLLNDLKKDLEKSDCKTP